MCDGTLLSANWVLTTVSCFQGQSRATWIAVFGNVRTSVVAPWTQRRRIVSYLKYLLNNDYTFHYLKIGMVKSPVEGSTAALIRLQTPVAFSDFVRPICLPDDDIRITAASEEMAASTLNPSDRPVAQKYRGSVNREAKKVDEDRQYFQVAGELEEDIKDDSFVRQLRSPSTELIDEDLNVLKPEPQFQRSTSFYGDKNLQNQRSLPAHQWQQCNTLGWSRQREHLQRVQLKLIDMKSCENISITTVNSICAESAYQKQDCSVSNSIIIIESSKTNEQKLIFVFSGGRVCW